MNLVESSSMNPMNNTLSRTSLSNIYLYTGKKFKYEVSELSTKMAKKTALLHVTVKMQNILLKREKLLLAPSKRRDIWLPFAFSLP